MTKRTCDNCERELTGRQRRWCSVRCRAAFDYRSNIDERRRTNRERAAANYEPVNHSPRTCVVCSESFTPTRVGKVICSKQCKMRRDKANRRSKDYRDPSGTERCGLCGEPFMLPGVASGKYCSADCEKRVTNSKRYPSSTPRPRIHQFDCENCGITCTPGKSGVDSKASRFCSFQCKREWHRDRRRFDDGQFVESVSRESIFKRDDWKCQLCGGAVPSSASFPDPQSPTLDHIIPLSKGGTHEPSNVQLAHYGCNSAKGNRVFGDGEQLRLIA